MGLRGSRRETPELGDVAGPRAPLHVRDRRRRERSKIVRARLGRELAALANGFSTLPALEALPGIARSFLMVAAGLHRPPLRGCHPVHGQNKMQPTRYAVPKYSRTGGPVRLLGSVGVIKLHLIINRKKHWDLKMFDKITRDDPIWMLMSF